MLALKRVVVKHSIFRQIKLIVVVYIESDFEYGSPVL